MVNLKILIVSRATKWLIFQNSVTYITKTFETQISSITWNLICVLNKTKKLCYAKATFITKAKRVANYNYNYNYKIINQYNKTIAKRLTQMTTITKSKKTNGKGYAKTKVIVQ